MQPKIAKMVRLGRYARTAPNTNAPTKRNAPYTADDLGMVELYIDMQAVPAVQASRRTAGLRNFHER